MTWAQHRLDGEQNVHQQGYIAEAELEAVVGFVLAVVAVAVVVGAAAESDAAGEIAAAVDRIEGPMYTQFQKFVAFESGCLDQRSLREACCFQRTFEQMDLDILPAFGEILHLKGYYHLKQNQERAIHRHPFACAVLVIVKSSQADQLAAVQAAVAASYIQRGPHDPISHHRRRPDSETPPEPQ